MFNIYATYSILCNEWVVTESIFLFMDIFCLWTNFLFLFVDKFYFVCGHFLFVDIFCLWTNFFSFVCGQIFFCLWTIFVCGQIFFCLWTIFVYGQFFWTIFRTIFLDNYFLFVCGKKLKILKKEILNKDKTVTDIVL